MQVKFINKSYSISSTIACIVISIAVAFPFVLISILGVNYKKLSDVRFLKTYGSITEGVEVAD